MLSLLGHACQCDPSAALPCASTTECPTDQLCRDTLCRRVCNHNSDCDPGQTCSEGACMPAAPRPDATASSDRGLLDAAGYDSASRDGSRVDAFNPDRTAPDLTAADLSARDQAPPDLAIVDSIRIDAVIVDSASGTDAASRDAARSDAVLRDATVAELVRVDSAPIADAWLPDAVLADVTTADHRPLDVGLDTGSASDSASKPDQAALADTTSAPDQASGADAAAGDAGPPIAYQLACAARYGTTTNFLYCTGGTGWCEFYVATAGLSCQTLCTQNGGSCLGTRDNQDPVGNITCEAKPDPKTCADALADGLCRCTTEVFDGGFPDAAGPSCSARYGAVTGFVLCSESELACEFYADNRVAVPASCDTICQAAGGACLGAANDTTDSCPALPTTYPCNSTQPDLICTCTR
ncbi:MAG: hypothetical protein ABIJ09_08580 [Pseudomonadota bacterium]